MHKYGESKTTRIMMATVRHVTSSSRLRNFQAAWFLLNRGYLEQVQSYKYLGSTVNSDNSIEEEIQYRITLRNKAYYANQFFFRSRLVSKKSKLKLYWCIIRPIHTPVKHGFWKKLLKNKLMVF